MGKSVATKENNMLRGSVYEKFTSIAQDATKSEVQLISHLKLIPAAELIYMSITELAEKTLVGEATILRFCRKLGFSGFQDFKLNLSYDVATNVQDVAEMNAKVAAEMNNTINQTSKSFDKETLKKATSKIFSARKICVFAVGNSNIAALATKYRLLKFNIDIDHAFDPHVQTVVTANLTEEDLLILISVSGSTKDIINLAEIAKKNKTSILAITNYLKSPLANLADFILYNARKENPFEGGSLATVVGQIYLVDLLCAYIFNELGSVAKLSYKKSSESVSDKLL
ncbi:MAG: MurR/RpiR family transcriptional regulator [Firmicutes bacterium]|nr:MurR/RpiR family transcriptional regulator [Bacillota bacterium]